jgi:hypothetical protein
MSYVFLIMLCNDQRDTVPTVIKLNNAQAFSATTDQLLTLTHVCFLTQKKVRKYQTFVDQIYGKNIQVGNPMINIGD